MRLKKDGTRWAMDLSIQHQGKQDYWRGDLAQTRAFYRRVVATALADMAYKQSDYDRHFDPALMSKAVKAMDALAKHLAEVSE